MGIWIRYTAFFPCKFADLLLRNYPKNFVDLRFADVSAQIANLRARL
jgi:hypothetical protein